MEIGAVAAAVYLSDHQHDLFHEGARYSPAAHRFAHLRHMLDHITQISEEAAGRIDTFSKSIVHGKFK
jgi:hypothetical protein